MSSGSRLPNLEEDLEVDCNLKNIWSLYTECIKYDSLIVIASKGAGMKEGRSDEKRELLLSILFLLSTSPC
jgi:hypothetical protein